MEPQWVIALIMFLGGSLSDLETRRVPNRYWIPYLVAAGAFALHGTDLVALAVAAGAAGVFYILWRVGLFGGADAKGLMVLALLTPSVPDLYTNHTVLAFDALVDATLFMVALPLLFLVWNLMRGDVALPAAFLGIRMDLAHARARHLWPMQEVSPAGLRWRFRHRIGVDVDPAFAALARAGVARPWVTPKIPFMVPLTAGLVVAAFQGNLVLWAMAALLA